MLAVHIPSLVVMTAIAVVAVILLAYFRQRGEQKEVDKRRQSRHPTPV